MAVSCIVFEIKRNIGLKTPIFHTPLVFNLHDPLAPLHFFSKILIQTAQDPELLEVQNVTETFNPLSSNVRIKIASDHVTITLRVSVSLKSEENTFRVRVDVQSVLRRPLSTSSTSFKISAQPCEKLAHVS